MHAFRSHIAAVTVAAALGLTGGAADAQSLDLGLLTDYDTGGAGISLQYGFAPVIDRSNWTGNWAVAARADADGDAWIGAGFSAEIRLSDALFATASFMPGYYVEGETVLGGNVHFRSLLGLGWNVTDTGAVFLSIDHLSNGGLEEVNPGSEAITLGYRMRF